MRFSERWTGSPIQKSGVSNTIRSRKRSELEVSLLVYCVKLFELVDSQEHQELVCLVGGGRLEGDRFSLNREGT